MSILYVSTFPLKVLEFNLMLILGFRAWFFQYNHIFLYYVFLRKSCGTTVSTLESFREQADHLVDQLLNILSAIAQTNILNVRLGKLQKKSSLKGRAIRGGGVVKGPGY